MPAAAPSGLGSPASQDFLPYRLAAGTTVHRIHRAGKGAVFFGPNPGVPPGNRFDEPAGQYRTLYVAERFDGAFIETVLRRPTEALADHMALAERVVREHGGVFDTSAAVPPPPTP